MGKRSPAKTTTAGAGSHRKKRERPPLTRSDLRTHPLPTILLLTHREMPADWCAVDGANGLLMARMIPGGSADHRTNVQDIALTWAFVVERVTGIEPALSAWESDRTWPITSAIRQGNSEDLKQP
jgi:hypothetical protein